MPRSSCAYLIDIIDACEAVEAALHGVDQSHYENNRLIRSSVERELILIGEAVASLARLDPSLAAHISHARMIIGLRNLLTHEYAAIRDDTIWAIAVHDVPVLRAQCRALMEAMEGAG
jgi:uncharacterized protein with HEPN domain